MRRPDPKAPRIYVTQAQWDTYFRWLGQGNTIENPIYDAAGWLSLWCQELEGWLLVDATVSAAAAPDEIHPVEIVAALAEEKMELVKEELASPWKDLETGKRKEIHDRQRRVTFVIETVMALAEKHRRFPAEAFEEQTRDE